jgi:hypothetical protein
MKTLYNKRPKKIGEYSIDVSEYFSYQYLPIKLAGSSDIVIEKRINVFNALIGRALCDYVGEFGLDEFINSYVYLTAKHSYQKEGCGFNRPGWHSDGFGTNDINYIWSNKQPTIFNSGDFYLTDDDEISMVEMLEQADDSKNYSFPNNTLIRMDQFTIHKVAPYESGNRAFVKISISKDKYNLRGNSINYELDYDWDYVERSTKRNIPQQ